MDILNIDAYNYGNSFAESSEKISQFLKRDGIIAWGMIPTASNVLKDDIDSLVAKLEGYIGLLCEKKIDRRKIINSSLITPSCGCGALKEKEAEGVLETCAKFSQLAKAQIT